MQLLRSAIYRIIEDSYRKKIVIYGCNEQTAKILKKLSLVDIEVAYFLEKKPKEKNFLRKPVFDLESITMEELEHIRIIVADKGQASELEQMNLKRNKHFRFLTYNEAERQEYRMDPNIGYNLPLKEENGYCGFRIFGNKDATDMAVILGNSTSDPYLFPFKCWSEYLGEKLNKDNRNYKILCGAVSGHMSPQELIKLIRDVVPLKPKWVICYEGFQDMNNLFRNPDYPFIHPYQKEFAQSLNIDKWIGIYYTKGYSFGINSGMSSYQLWKYSMRMMYAVCQEFGINFMGILQPNIINKKACYGKKDWEILLHYEIRGELAEWYQKFQDERKCDGWCPNYICDFSEVFRDYDGIYLDGCHVSEQGNQVIANLIYQELLRRGI